MRIKILDGKKGLVFDIKRDCSEDGPGIRSTVFFKGCPLSCIWCQNPEGISARASVAFSSDRCDPRECGGYACIEVCSENALKIDVGSRKIRIDRGACTRCDKCFEVCTPRALEPAGKWWGVEELVRRVLVDKDYFRSTGGGVTLSGGEPTLQTEFLHDFLVELKKEDVNIGMETSGMFPKEKFQRYILPYLDFIYFDLKLIGPEESRKYTGRSNEQIISNFLFLHYESEVPLIPRIPLIPDITTRADNLAGIADFLRRHGVTACSLMPYNPMWHDKAVKHGVRIQYFRTEFMSKEEEEKCVRYFSSRFSMQDKGTG